MIKEITTLNKPLAGLVAELRALLEEAEQGRLRGILFAAYRTNTGDPRFGNVGDYSLSEFALALKLMELELDSIVTNGQEPD